MRLRQAGHFSYCWRDFLDRRIAWASCSSAPLVKFVHQGVVVYATQRSPRTWNTAYRNRNVINAIFDNGELSAITGEEFTLESEFDFFCLNDIVLVSNKLGFESVLKYRDRYLQAFGDLRVQAEFSGIFSDMQPLIDHVGTNSMNLRRMAAVKEKNLYSRPGFIAAVQQVNETRNLGIIFDAQNRIVPTPETARLILKILLDQRLLSEITEIMYDVPDGVPV